MKMMMMIFILMIRMNNLLIIFMIMIFLKALPESTLLFVLFNNILKMFEISRSFDE